MLRFHPCLEDLPEIFPVFPLAGALLMPEGRLPLNIFEPRYLAMVEDALAAGRMFGMIQPDPARPRGEFGPGLYRVGCLGRVSSFSETEDGRYLITLTGVIRFVVAGEVEARRGYRRVRGDFTGYAGDLDRGATLPSLDRVRLGGLLRTYFARQRYEVEWEAIEAMPAALLLATLAMICPFEPAEKQALLEAPDLAARAQALRALLEIALASGAVLSQHATG
jgi:Lon protease-like protein